MSQSSTCAIHYNYKAEGSLLLSEILGVPQGRPYLHTGHGRGRDTEIRVSTGDRAGEGRDRGRRVCGGIGGVCVWVIRVRGLYGCDTTVVSRRVPTRASSGRSARQGIEPRWLGRRRRIHGSRSG